MTTRMHLILGLLIGLMAGAWAQEADIDWDGDKLVKNKMCSMCHGKAQVGDQVSVWEEGPHAKAFETLKTDKAKEVAAKLGIDDPATSGECLQCHSTAYGFTKEKISDAVDVEEGVSCQSCHGPGKDYVRTHRKDVEKAIAEQGLMKGTEATCKMCHNDNNPTQNPEQYTLPDGTKVAFDFEQAYEKIKHLMKR